MKTLFFNDPPLSADPGVFYFVPCFDGKIQTHKEFVKIIPGEYFVVLNSFDFSKFTTRSDNRAHEASIYATRALRASKHSVLSEYFHIKEQATHEYKTTGMIRGYFAISSKLETFWISHYDYDYLVELDNLELF